MLYLVNLITLMGTIYSFIPNNGLAINNKKVEIHFQNNFHNDSLSLRLNKCEVFSDLPLNSNNIYGFTGIKIGVTKYKDGITIAYLGESRKCNSKIDKILYVDITINKIKLSFEIDLKKGMYVGFSKDKIGKLIFLQSHVPFEYD